MTPQMRLAVSALFVSHGVSFVHNYLVRGERAAMGIGRLMAAPYARVVAMHVSILAGGFVLMALDSPVILLLVLVVLKTLVDLNLHKREHQPRSRPAVCG